MRSMRWSRGRGKYWWAHETARQILIVLQRESRAEGFTINSNQMPTSHDLAPVSQTTLR
jgi:hypothetical protein